MRGARRASQVGDVGHRVREEICREQRQLVGPQVSARQHTDTPMHTQFRLKWGVLYKCMQRGPLSAALARHASSQESQPAERVGKSPRRWRCPCTSEHGAWHDRYGGAWWRRNALHWYLLLAAAGRQDRKRAQLEKQSVAPTQDTVGRPVCCTAIPWLPTAVGWLAGWLAGWRGRDSSRCYRTTCRCCVARREWFARPITPSPVNMLEERSLRGRAGWA